MGGGVCTLLGMTDAPVHAFTDDALGTDDATAVAARIAAGEVSVAEVTAAAVDRAEKVQPLLNPVAFAAYDDALSGTTGQAGPFAGVPTFVKDNLDVTGMPTNHGSAAWRARPATHDSVFVGQLRAQGLVLLGKSRLPEFGFNASTEFAGAEPTRNPWNPDHSAGASSGGAAALVAAGVVPLAHANDGGGSIRIPAAACGLVGLKPTRGRFKVDPADSVLPVQIISQGVVTRTVRDTAGFVAGLERTWRNQRLPVVGEVTGPSRRRLRVGVVLDSVNGTVTDDETRAAVTGTADLLADLGHHVAPAPVPVGRQFADDFARYWGTLSLLLAVGGRRILDREFDATLTDNLSRGLAAMARRELVHLPGVIRRLRATTPAYRAGFASYDVVLSPVLARTTPRLGHLSPELDFDALFGRLLQYVTFTPLHNACGAPAVSLPLGRTTTGLPIGVHLAADLGAERTLLELAFELEQARPFPQLG